MIPLILAVLISSPKPCFVSTVSQLGLVFVTYLNTVTCCTHLSLIAILALLIRSQSCKPNHITRLYHTQ